MRTVFLAAALVLATELGLRLTEDVLLPPLRAEIVDRIVAVVDDRVIAWSGALAEANYQAFRSGREPVAELGGEPLRKMVSQLIDQWLLEKEKNISPFSPADNRDPQRSLEEVRKRFPSAEAYQKSLALHQLTEADLVRRLDRESTLLAFIDYRLRPQVRLAPEMVENYYNATLVPELRQRGPATAPPLAQVRDRIEQILTQQEINRLLEPWLEQLRQRAKIRMMS